MHSNFFRSVRPFSLCLAAALALTACGGGGDDAPVAGSQTGVFVDSAVSGLSYETSSGVKGTTDAQGQFKYNPGDTVTFKIGGVTLGTGKASGTVTPAHISEGGEDSNKFTNLLVLLQSLDTDGNPDNGITLPTSLDGSKIAKVAERLNDDPADFTDDSKNAELKQASPRGEIRTREEARKHYEDTQAKASTFLDEAAGVWNGYEWDDEAYEAVLRLTPSGRYVLSVTSTSDIEPGAESGLEVGSLSVDATTGQVTTSDIKTDTNGDAGWSKLGDGRSVTIAFGMQDGGSKDTSRMFITLKVAGRSDMTFVMRRVRPSLDSLAGAWSTSPDLRANAGLLVFQYGQYSYVAPQATGTCTAPGSQVGGYETQQSISFDFGPPVDPTVRLVLGKRYQSIGDCNVWGDIGGEGLPIQLSEDGSVLTLLKPDSSGVQLKLYRIKRDKDQLAPEIS